MTPIIFSIVAIVAAISISTVVVKKMRVECPP